MRRLPEGNEELRAAGVGIAGVGHAQAALKMTAMVRPRLLAENPIARSSGAVALRIAALSHESLEHAMKIQVVVKSLLHKADKIADRLGGLVLEQFQHDGSLRRGQLHSRQVIDLRLG